MQISNFGHIFVYDNTPQNASVLHNILADGIYKTFRTGNIFEFVKYAGEITPDVMIFNLDDEKKHPLNTIENFNQQIRLYSSPIVFTQSALKKFTTHPRVAHYVYLPTEEEKLNDIVESYCLGNKKHQILLINAYSSEDDRLHQSLNKSGYSYFEVHNAEAAALYLSKNKPQAVWIEYSPQMVELHHHLQHNHIFYVDRTQDITEIRKFLN